MIFRYGIKRFYDMDKIRIVAGKEDEPEWMKGKFRDYWNMWQGGDIKMSEFCDLIDQLEER